MSSREMGDAIGCSGTVILRFLASEDLSVSAEVAHAFRIRAMTGRTTSNPKTDRYLKMHYLKVPVKALAIKVGRSSTFVRLRLRQLGLIIPGEIIEQRRLASRIRPGNVSFNKGLKQSEFMSPAAIRRTKVTRFKKGRVPHNTKRDLAITVRTDNRGVKIKHIRISLSKWMPLHRYNWERVNGKIPPKMKLVFKDHDTMNCDVGNLELLTPGQLMKRNSYHNYPEPIAKVIQLGGALTRQINKHLKKLKNEK